MEFVLDTHAHTIVSGHAYNTMNEMVAMAKKKGLQAISLTEHAPKLPWTTGVFYFQNLYVVPRERDGIRLFLGVELNILNELGEVDLEEELCSKLDIVIASIHAPHTCYGESRGIVKNTEAYINAMKHKFIHIIGHPDDSRYPVDFDTLVAAAKEHHVLLELNNSSLNPAGYRKGAEENQMKMLELCEKYHVSVSLGSDAHVDVDLGNFTRVQKVIEACDFPEELVMNTSVEKLENFIKFKQNM